MPTLTANGIRLRYEVHGSGEPLVLIAGLASDHTLYDAMIPSLAKRFTVIAFDNRGIGHSDQPDTPYTIAMMADDTLGLLDALGIECAHVFGTSMGGRIAFDLALRYPARVKKLVLMSTGLSPAPPFWAFLLGLWVRTPARDHSVPYQSILRQRQAVRAYNAMDRLGDIRVPTLILHGKRDGLAPFRWAQQIHQGIRGSELIPYPGGHLFFVLRMPEVAAAVVGFLSRRISLDGPDQSIRSALALPTDLRRTRRWWTEKRSP